MNGKTRDVVTVTFDVEATGRKTEPADRTHSSSIPQHGDSKDLLVKARDNVKIVAKVGWARIEAVARRSRMGRWAKSFASAISNPTASCMAELMPAALCWLIIRRHNVRTSNGLYCR